MEEMVVKPIISGGGWDRLLVTIWRRAVQVTRDYLAASSTGNSRLLSGEKRRLLATT
jgi:hypothetical protein